jgi:L-asparaginase
VVLETFGAGNAPTDAWLSEALRTAIGRGIVIVNVSQCEGGRVTQGQYQTSTRLQQIGVVSGADMTTEAAITKLMVLLGQETETSALERQLGQSLRGEMSS